jgi:ABC-2 type transport system permease protein
MRLNAGDIGLELFHRTGYLGTYDLARLGFLGLLLLRRQGIPLALSSFTLPSALLILVYFLLGYALFAMINSVCGATVSRAEDLQSAMMPSIIISIISFYSAYVVMFLPDQGIRRIVTYVPLTAPFIMPFRLLNENVPAADILISIVSLILAIIVVAALSVKLYSASVLHYGQRLKLREMFKLKV